MMRLFVGLSVPEEARGPLLSLAAMAPIARRPVAENLHLTLRFVGEVDRGLAEDIDLALDAIRAPAFTLIPSGVGAFGPEGKTRSLWAGIAPNPALDHLRAKVERAVASAGGGDDTRRFRPHITLGRPRGGGASDVARFLGENAGFTGPSFTVGAITLFESRLGGDAPVYTALAHYPLKGAGDDWRDGAFGDGDLTGRA